MPQEVLILTTAKRTLLTAVGFGSLFSEVTQAKRQLIINFAVTGGVNIQVIKWVIGKAG